MKRQVIFIAVAFAVLVGWSVVLFDVFKANEPVISSSKIVKYMKKENSNEVVRLEHKSKEVAHKRDTAAVDKRLIEPTKLNQAVTVVEDAANSRMGKIKNLVKSAIDMDSQKLADINDEVSILKEKLMDLSQKENKLHNRLSKLNKIENIFGHKSTKNVSSLKSEADTYEAIKSYNKGFQDKAAELKLLGKKTQLTFNGHNLLIIDNKPLRVSEIQAISLQPVIESLKVNTKMITSAAVFKTEKTPLSRVKVIASYLKRQYGIQPRIIPISGQNNKFDIPIRLISQPKASKDFAKNFDEEGIL